MGKFHDACEVSRRIWREGIVFRIAQDLSSRLGIAADLVRPDDYQGDLEDLIREKFPSQRAFCGATSLSEPMLSHVLAGRKDLSLKKLTGVLERVGYRLRIVPAPESQPATQKRTG